SRASRELPRRVLPLPSPLWLADRLSPGIHWVSTLAGERDVWWSLLVLVTADWRPSVHSWMTRVTRSPVRLAFRSAKREGAPSTGQRDWAAALGAHPTPASSTLAAIRSAWPRRRLFRDPPSLTAAPPHPTRSRCLPRPGPSPGRPPPPGPGRSYSGTPRPSARLLLTPPGLAACLDPDTARADHHRLRIQAAGQVAHPHPRAQTAGSQGPGGHQDHLAAGNRLQGD